MWIFREAAETTFPEYGVDHGVPSSVGSRDFGQIVGNPSLIRLRKVADDSGADGFEAALTCVSTQPNMRFQGQLSSHDWSDCFALPHRREARRWR
jgi:hypothetical protein